MEYNFENILYSILIFKKSLNDLMRSNNLQVAQLYLIIVYVRTILIRKEFRNFLKQILLTLQFFEKFLPISNKQSAQSAIAVDFIFYLNLSNLVSRELKSGPYLNSLFPRSKSDKARHYFHKDFGFALSDLEGVRRNFR